MTTDSYSVSCFVKKEDGKYHMECDMFSGGKNYFSYCDGDDFTNCLNEIINNITTQVFEKPEPEPEPEKTPEEKVEYLEKLVEQLQNENAKLTDTINKTKNKKPQNTKNNYDRLLEDIFSSLM